MRRPAMIEKHAADHRQVSLKTQRRRRLDVEGPARRRDALKRPRRESATARGERAKKTNRERLVF